MKKPPPPIDVGILTIREDEFEALLQVFSEKIGIHSGRREYALVRANAGESASYTVALLRQIEQGNGEAQDAARDLLDDLSPSLLIVTGIAATVPSDEVSLGDVVLSTRIHDFTVEARKTTAKTTYSETGGPIARALQAKIANLQARLEELGDWAAGVGALPEVHWRGKENFYGPQTWRREVQEQLKQRFGGGEVNLRFTSGPIASSDRLVKDPSVLFPWVTTARHLKAIEMESGGAYRAARERCPMLAIRGISDIVGFRRDDAWTKTACRSAAGFTKAFLRTTPVPTKETSPVATSDPLEPASPVDRDEVFACSRNWKRCSGDWRRDSLPRPTRRSSRS